MIYGAMTAYLSLHPEDDGDSGSILPPINEKRPREEPSITANKKKPAVEFMPELKLPIILPSETDEKYYGFKAKSDFYSFYKQISRTRTRHIPKEVGGDAVGMRTRG